MKPSSDAKPGVAEPVVLEPYRDLHTGQVVYAAASTWQPGIADLTLTPDRGIVATAPDGVREPEPESRIPQGRMAAASWDQIAQALRDAEDGRPGRSDVELRGGQLVLTDRDKGSQPVSRLPQERMAAVNVPPSQADVAELRRLDPDNAEQWSPVLTDLVAGWTFRLSPLVPGQQQFVFFAFRSPSDGNAFRIAVLQPDMDSEFGHTPHMVRAYVGGKKIPVICGPDGRPAQNLAEVRTHAGKWMAYTSRRMAGLSPGFSL
jgi:hypothetical protein